MEYIFIYNIENTHYANYAGAHAFIHVSSQVKRVVPVNICFLAIYSDVPLLRIFSNSLAGAVVELLRSEDRFFNGLALMSFLLLYMTNNDISLSSRFSRCLSFSVYLRLYILSGKPSLFVLLTLLDENRICAPAVCREYSKCMHIMYIR